MYHYIIRLLKQNEILVVPGVYDALSARIAGAQGFEVLAITGYGVEASAIGKPDLGLATMDTVVRQAKYIVESTDAAVICDIDTGYGGVVNVWQTIKEMQRVGVAAVHIEDQTIPNKCGGMPGRGAPARRDSPAGGSGAAAGPWRSAPAGRS